MTQVIIIVISTLCAILGWIVHRKTERIKIMENQLSERKYKAYSELVTVFYGILKDIKNKKNTNQKFMAEKMIDSKRDILMYGSDDVFLKFNEWLCSTHSEIEDDQKTKTQMDYFLALVLEIRKDMQGGKTKLNQNDILLNLTQNKKEAQTFIN